MYDDDCLEVVAHHSLNLCCGGLHLREGIERPSAGDVVVGFEKRE